MNDSFAVLLAAVAAAVLAALFQKEQPLFALLVSLAASLVLLAKLGGAARELLSGLARLEQNAGGDAYGTLLRCAGIVLLADYTRTLCEEAGAEALAWCTGLAGRVLALAAAWPLLEEIGRRLGSLLR